MTLFIPAAFGLYRHEFTVTGDLEPMYCTFGWSAAEGEVDLQVVADAIHAAGKTLHAAIAAASCTIQKTIVELKPQTDADMVVAESISAAAGGSTGEELTQNTTYLVKKRTALGGRMGRGRCFWPGVRATIVDAAGVITPATVTAYNGHLATYLGAVNAVAGVGTMQLVHSIPQSGQMVQPHTVLGLTLDSRVASQRRRLRR